jgi:anti-anti-sigma regulatory factor
VAVQSIVADDDGRLLVALAGDLDMPDVVPVRLRLLKCLAEHPEALLIDVSDLVVRQPLALSVLTAIVRQAARWPGVPVLICAPPGDTRQILDGAAFRRLPVFGSLRAARDHAGAHRVALPTLTDELLPVSGAARQARNVATDACVRWDLPELVAPASLVASELVGNVVDHARTMMTLRVTLRRRYLHVSVADGSSAEPVRTRDLRTDAVSGRGLMLVEATAHSWGWLPTDTGKVVWAALPVGAPVGGR